VNDDIESEVMELKRIVKQLNDRIAVLEVKVQQLQWQINQTQYKR